MIAPLTGSMIWVPALLLISTGRGMT